MQGLKTLHPVLLVSLLVLAVPAPAETAAQPPDHEVVLESGMVWPGGDLKDEFQESPHGFGAEPGIELGFRYRHRLGSRFSLSPSFHFVNFGEHIGQAPGLGEYRIHPTGYRYSLELMLHKAGPAGGLRPFAGVGVGLYRNRVTGYDKDLATPIDGSANSLGLAARCGLRRGQFEISLVYHRNRFETWQFFWTDCCQAYSWDSLGLRLGWGIP